MPQISCSDLKAPRMTKRRYFRVQIIGCPKSVVVGRNTLWTVRVTRRGKPLGRNATMGVEGGMPSMGHPFYTAAFVLRTGRVGVVVLKMRFAMKGRWFFQLTIAHQGVADTVRYTVDV